MSPPRNMSLLNRVPHFNMFFVMITGGCVSAMRKGTTGNNEDNALEDGEMDDEDEETGG